MNFFRKVRENLKDPKKKSLTLLGIYAVFFIIVFILLRFGETANYNYNQQKDENIIDTQDEILDYNYSYKIENNSEVTEIVGTYKDGIDTFNYKEFNYKKENEIVYLNNEPIEIDFDIDKYKYDKIELLIENSDSETKYKNSNKIVYTINSTKYFELLNEENNCSVIDCTNINIPIEVEKDEIISSVLIDLSNYYNYKYTIQIIYSPLIYD